MKASSIEIECINYSKKIQSKYKKISLFEKLFITAKKKETENVEVSEVKTFNQLWSDFGLRDYGVNYWHRGRFNREDKKECIKKWVEILYSNKINIDELENQLTNKNEKIRKKFYDENPNGHITTSDPVDLIPKEIDRIVPSYNPSIYTVAIELNPYDPNAYYKRGDSKFEIQDWGGAIDDYSKAIDLDPKYIAAYNSRGLAKSILKDCSGAIDDYGKAIQIDPENEGAYYNRGKAYIDIGEYSKAIVDFTKTIEMDPTFGPNYYFRGLSKMHIKDYTGAIKDFTQTIDIDPEEGAPYEKRGLCKKEIGDLIGAELDIKKYKEFNFIR